MSVIPNYEYTCVNCDTTTERIVKIEDREHQRCLDCGYKLNRVYSFKGSVWAPTASNGGHK